MKRYTIDSPDDAAIKESLSGEFVDYREHRNLVYELKTQNKALAEELEEARERLGEQDIEIKKLRALNATK